MLKKSFESSIISRVCILFSLLLLSSFVWAQPQPTVKVLIHLDKTLVKEKIKSNIGPVEVPVCTIEETGRNYRSNYQFNDEFKLEKYHDDLQFFLQNGSEQRPLAVPEAIRKRILYYLVEVGSKNKNHDCSSFVHFVSNVPRMNFLDDLSLSDWEIRSGEQANPGESIVIGINNPSLRSDDWLKDRIEGRDQNLGDFFPHHFALCLKKDLFLSKLGSTDLLISDLKTILKIYQSDVIFTLRKRE